MQMHMHVFVFHFLNVWMTKRTLSTNLNYLFKATVLTNFSSKQNDTLRFWIENLFSTLEKLLIQIKYKSNSIIDHQKQYGSLLWLKMTLPNQETIVWLRYFFVKENWKWHTIHKNIHNSLHNGGGIMERKGVSTEVYWSQTAKLLNRTEESEEKPNSEGKLSLLWSLHLLHKEKGMHPTYCTWEVRCILISLKRGCDGASTRLQLDLWSQFAAQFRDLSRASDVQ